MKNDDVKLIQRILAGDEAAFGHLITKYQKRVHAHAWRKTGDFQIAEDITQETFLQVYQRLGNSGRTDTVSKVDSIRLWIVSASHGSEKIDYRPSCWKKLTSRK